MAGTDEAAARLTDRPVTAVRTVGGHAETAALQTVVTAYGRLSALAAGGTDVADVARLLAETAGSDVALLSPTLTVLTASGPPGSHQDVVERLRSHTGRRGLAPVLTAAGGVRRAMTLPGSADPSSCAVIAPITAGDEMTAYLVTFAGDPGALAVDTLLLLAEHAAMVCGVVLGHERVVAAAAGRARQDLVEGVLTGHARIEGDISRWASHLGFSHGTDHHVLVASARQQPSATGGPAIDHRAHATIEAFLTHHTPDAIVAARADEIVAVVPCPTGTALAHVKNLAVRCRAAIERRHRGTVTGIGIGGQCAEADAIARSYTQARRSLETTWRHTRQGGVVAYPELGIERLLLQVPEVATLQAFAREVLGSALEQDATGGSEHLRTLSMYFRENCSPRHAAAELHVHPNTVSYRIRRIEELTGLSLSTYRDRLLAQVAVAILVSPDET